MRIITENRGEMIKALEITNPTKIIAPYGYAFPTDYDTKIIMQNENCRKLNKPGIVLYSENMHTKLAIGKTQAIIGSWNFTRNSTETMHELINVITETTLLQQLNEYFDRLWHRLDKR